MKRPGELATVMVMGSLITAAGLLDWWLAVNYGQQATMTDLIRRVTFNNAWLLIAIVYAFGCLTGHFFLWPDYDPTQEIEGNDQKTQR